MSNVKLVQEAAEAINSGLFQTDFKALGNTEGGRVDWWYRGRPDNKLAQVRVSVERAISIPYVIVTAEYPALLDGQVRGLSMNWKIPCDGTQKRAQVIDATTEVLVKVLELFRDILAGTPPLPTPTPVIDGINEFEEDAFDA